ncbi:4-azaleucine resistance probable transporter AzlC [Natronincola peptidivorans]|uniref:4-azaleucine resistance probable transporter AzlC n=1 Tax=Natronincola peptidivorans TaxID=426128 RepID=A0A1I0D5R0_9FIRM|nr:AzlC family ABC transporter permease [Natronincola peptidivorans]SET27354.1 4-azaleucine resistance probable transporter AzlC [Natronincola peptidivorans]
MDTKNSYTVNNPLNISSSIVTKRAEFLKGIKKALPIVIGYFPIAVSFGVISAQTGIPLFYTVLMSFMVYAGASQFMAANMLGMGILGFEVVFATFILNFRHFIMSMSLMNKLQHLPMLQKVPLSFGITDETFALLSMEGNDDAKDITSFFIAGVMLSAYFSWGLGTLLGGLLSMVIPASIGASMSIGLYAMFIGLLIPSVKDNYRIGILAAISGILCYIFNIYLNSGWAIVMATLVGSFIGTFIVQGE